MLTFLGAFSLECFLNSDRVARSTLAVVWFLVGFLVMWCIYTVWTNDYSVWERMLQKVGSIREFSRTFLRKLFPENSERSTALEGDASAV